FGTAPPILADGRPALVPGDCNVKVQWRDLQFDVEQGTLRAGIDLKDIHGGGLVSGSFEPLRHPPPQSQGELNIDSLTWNNFRFTKIAGPMFLDDQRVVLGSNAESLVQGRAQRRISALCYGGAAQADGWVWLDNTPRFQLRAVLENVDLKKFC